MNLPTKLALLFLLGLLSACGGDDPTLAEGVFGPLGTARPNATEAERTVFARGEAVALRRFTPEDGLGPNFNVTFCGGCHEKPVFGGSAGRYRNFLLVRQTLSDGSSVDLGESGVLPQFNLETGRRPTDEGATDFALRNPIPFFGVGLLAELSEEVILANADPNDDDGDGISGRPNIDRGFIGRFGRKAQTVTIEGFIRGPLANHLGITSNPLPEALRAQLPVPSPVFERGGIGGAVIGRRFMQAAAPDAAITDDDGIPDPELSDQDLFDLVSWSMLLAAPERAEPTEATERGEALFETLECTACHVPALDGPRGFVPALSDLLLHDMGPELADGFAFGEASGSEFRTQPLWGVGAVGPYLHDGRADTLAEAIRWHGGEAAASRARFDALSDAERGDVLAFLRSLGGEAQHTDGLVPPDADLEAIPPSRALSADEAARYLEGRALFDQDTFGSEGLGPRFNGDSCRACHFEPIVGGAGPGGVDVIRHGMVDGDAFVAPDFGTIAHRFEMAPVRPRFDARANLVERRQTPSLLGLGLLEAIPEAAILAGEDPLDADEDGIAGVAHRLPDGRLGRFGWKADVPSLHEFVRDALGAELGVTVPPEDGQSFGAASDDDGVPDPEFDVDQIESMRFFLATLGAPGGAPDVAGETLFADTGCADCHRTLEGPDGPVRAFTDLLLHDVQGDAFVGVPSANAGGRLFRTAPLWGIAGTAPYWHDGRASTLEDAIAAHEGTASAARQAFEALSAEARERLLNFLSAL